MSFLDQAKAIHEDMIANRRHLHQNPEIGFDIPKTASFVKDKLRSYGLEPQDIGKNGVTALLGRPGGKCILLRADMDGLPIVEDSQLEFAATNGFSHTCGHDMHTAILLAAAKLLKEQEDQLKGYVKFIFQPAEELLIGGKAMVEAGILDNPKVDMAFGLHVAPNAPLQAIAYAPEKAMASAYNFRITISGKGGHGAMPHLGIDPVYIGAQLVNALTALPAREVAFDNSLAVTVGRFEGLGAMNIIPDQVVLEGTARTLSETSRDYIKTRLPELVEGIVKTHRGEVTIDILADCPVLINNKDLSQEAAKVLADQFDSLPIVPIPANLASEDFAYYADQVPSFFFNLCNPHTLDGSELFPVHHPKVVFGEDMMPVGVASFVSLVHHFLSQD